MRLVYNEISVNYYCLADDVSMQRLPDVLIIGAMKAGTTTLYRDLLSNPNIVFPTDKEPGNLCDDAVLSEEGLTKYSSLFKTATKTQLCVDASTNYTKLPDFSGCAERAKIIMPSGLRIIYLVRNPLHRSLSHYRHLAVQPPYEGLFDPDDFIMTHNPIVNYSRYAMQISSWYKYFSKEQIKIIIFEEYVRDRRRYVSEIQAWLGLPPNAQEIMASSVYNASVNKPVMNSAWKKVRDTRIYNDYIRPILTPSIRNRISTLVLPKSGPVPDPAPETIKWLSTQLQDDALHFSQIAGYEEPIWNLSDC